MESLHGVYIHVPCFSRQICHVDQTLAERFVVCVQSLARLLNFPVNMPDYQAEKGEKGFVLILFLCCDFGSFKVVF